MEKEIETVPQKRGKWRPPLPPEDKKSFRLRAEAELRRVMREIEQRAKEFGICDVTIGKIPQQLALFNDLKDRLKVPLKDRIRFYLYYGWNGAGKTFVGAYVTTLLALGEDTKKYSLPFLWVKKNIWILTKSGSNVKSVIHPYLLWEGSKTRIPPEMVKKVNMDNGILKGILLTNGCEIHVKTYDQGSENLQGGNPDWIWMDEEPVDEDVFGELIARTRSLECEMLITMTPLNGLTRIYEYFLNQSSENVKNKSKVYLVSSLDNPYTDKTWTEGLTEEEYRLRVDWSFENPTWLVYSQFNRSRNVLDADIKDLGTNLKFYRAIDFWVSHPTWVIFLAQDEDDNFFVFDEIYESNFLLRDLKSLIDKKSDGVGEFVYTIRDSAAKREGIELANLWMKTVPADKHSKGENEMSNRRSGILMVNQLLKDGKLMISPRCKSLIKEFESHYYKEGGKKDGEVNKVDDDLLDALRYVLFMIRKNGKSKTPTRIEYSKKFLSKPKVPLSSL